MGQNLFAPAPFGAIGAKIVKSAGFGNTFF
jgi:hypothetical protein